MNKKTGHENGQVMVMLLIFFSLVTSQILSTYSIIQSRKEIMSLSIKRYELSQLAKSGLYLAQEKFSQLPVTQEPLEKQRLYQLITTLHPEAGLKLDLYLLKSGERLISIVTNDDYRHIFVQEYDLNTEEAQPDFQSIYRLN